MYEMVRIMAGISPKGPGWDYICIKPMVDYLPDLSGEVITPKGTVYFNQAGQPGLVVYKADGTEIVPELHPEYEGQTNTGINITNLGPYYTEIKYFLECLQDGKEITLAPLQEGVKSVEQALEEWEAAKLYLREKKEMYI